MTYTRSTTTHPVAILAVILVSYFMILLDNSVIFTALPSLQADLDLASTELAWVQDAYTLVFGGLLLLGARAGDLLGRRRVFVAGLAVFSVASLLIAVAPTGWWIIGARALQGMGAAIVAPTSLALLAANFAEGRERTRAIAWYGATAGIGASLGLVIGGALADAISWRAGFWVNVPIGIAMMVLAPRVLPESARAAGRFDVVGAVTATLGVGALVFGILHAAEEGWASLVTSAALATALVLLVGFVVNESRAEQPIMPLRLFASRVRAGAYLARFLYLGAMIGFFFFTTRFLQGVFGFSPLEAGLAFLPMTAVNFVVALAIPALTRRFGNTVPLIAGIALTLAGMLWLAQVTQTSGYVVAVALPMVLIGAGQGLAFAPLTAAGVAGTTAEDAGAASGLVNTFHQLGMALGLGILAAVAAAAVPETAGATADSAHSLSLEVGAALGGGTILLAISLMAAIVFIVPTEVRARSTMTTMAAADFPTRRLTTAGSPTTAPTTTIRGELTR